MVLRMSTRALVGVGTRDRFKAVYHRLDSDPWDLGNALLLEHGRRAGDLDALVAELLDAPGGWESFPGRTRAGTDGDDPPFFGPEHLDAAAVWMNWLYLFRPEQRLLEIYAGTTPAAFATCRLLAGGGSDPPCFPTPLESPTADIQEVDGWDLDDAGTRQARASFAECLRAAMGGRAETSARRATARLLAALLRGCDWKPPPSISDSERARRQQLGLGVPPPPAAPDPARLTQVYAWGASAWSAPATAWRVDLDGLALVYASPKHRFGGDLMLFDGAGAHAFAPLGDALAAAAERPDEPETAALAGHLLGALAQAAPGNAHLDEQPVWPLLDWLRATPAWRDAVAAHLDRD
jgi:hypothetical protein